MNKYNLLMLFQDLSVPVVPAVPVQQWFKDRGCGVVCVCVWVGIIRGSQG